MRLKFFEVSFLGADEVERVEEVGEGFGEDGDEEGGEAGPIE